MLDTTVAERLRRIEIPASAFAGVIGLHHAALSLYLNGRASPSAATEERIMSTLAELERLSRLFPALPNFRSVMRVKALLSAMQSGEFAPYEEMSRAETARRTT
ncbi:MAG TPA: hypothetical protein VOA41_17730 [Candidatus Dormibacteraeota bacterium]|nr:hypothetical protein [Candidatus Dormibacteraeota bacterium]